MPTIPGGNSFTPLFQPIDANGDPFPNGKLETFLAGTSTPHPVYLDPNLTTPATNPVVLDSAGKAIFWFDAVNYKFVFKDAADVVIWTVDGVQHVGQVQLARLGITMATGALAVVSGYVVLATDQLVTVNSTGGPSPAIVTLHLASVARFPLTIKNLGTEPVDVTPQAGDTIDGVAAPYQIPVAATPQFPSVMLAPNGATGWVILASHKV